jgi:hypothetical protein
VRVTLVNGSDFAVLIDLDLLVASKSVARLDTGTYRIA